MLFKYNPIYDTIETVTAFLLGLFAEGICKWIYDKWVKKDGTESEESSVEE